ncbi:MADS-box protein EJ2 [Vitis vinifera]|uniref:MADS-box protein EJ2 n=1 Tax=Vitis vinifera TaxID=29760 RepID=A0A438JYM3_VITVI|nr:MADS-box protein EJ2 [Vitis vinifera]
MAKTLEKYQKCSYGALEASQPVYELTQLSGVFEAKDKSGGPTAVSETPSWGRLGPVNTKELEQLEHQLEMSLKQIRSTKVGKIPNLTNQPDAELGFEHLGLIAGMFAVFGDILTVVYGFQTQNMLDQLADLQNKEHMLIEANNALRRKLEESNGKHPLQQSWEAAGNSALYSRLPAQSEGFFQPLERNSTLEMGYNAAGSNEITLAAPSQNDNGFGPGWMLWI